MSEIAEEAQFPPDFNIGSSVESLGYNIGGMAGDWISNTLGIVGSEVEIGNLKTMNKDFWPKSWELLKTDLDD